MRIRLWRRRHSVEIARFIPPQPQAPSRSGEWIKKVLPVSSDGSLFEESLESLEPAEKAGLVHLRAFLGVCDTIEALDTEAALDSVRVQTIAEGSESTKITQAKDTAGQGRLRRLLDRTESWPKDSMDRHGIESKSDDETTLMTVATTASTQVLSSLPIPPRPAKFSVLLRPISGFHNGDDESPPGGDFPSTRVPRLPDSSILPRRREDTPQTRFIPSVGWCVRRGPEKAPYFRVMFHDGASLEVDTQQSNTQPVLFMSDLNTRPM